MWPPFSIRLLILSVSPPRKRGSRGERRAIALDPRFRRGDMLMMVGRRPQSWYSVLQDNVSAKAPSHIVMFEFLGLFADAVAGLQARLLKRWPDVDIVEIASPFSAVAVRFPESSYDVANEYLPVSVTAEIRSLSVLYPGVRFLLLRTHCWGGDCSNRGELIRDGRVAYQTDGDEALRRLIGQFGVDIGAREIFPPLGRGFPWKASV